VKDITGANVSLKEYNVQSVTPGEDAQGGVTILINQSGETFRGHGVSTDTIEASTVAMLNAINRVGKSKKEPGM